MPTIEKIKCSHCRILFPKDKLISENISGKQRYFCCQGCRNIFILLNSSGLDSFYDKLPSKTSLLPKDKISNFNKFDSDGFTKKYITEENGLSKIHLLIDGIHCSACVWLNEKVLHRLDGIKKADINYTNHKATIIFDRDKIPLSKIIKTINDIGYSAFAYDISKEEKIAKKRRKNYYIKMIVAFVGAMNMMMLSVAKYAGLFGIMRQDVKDIIHIAEFLITTVVLFFSGFVFIKGAYHGIKNRFINMDFLVISGAMLAFIYSIYAMISKNGETYFDSVVMIITFVLFGKFLEVIAKKTAIDSVSSINSLIPLDATIISNGSKKIVAVEEIKKGDLVEVASGEIVPIDGEIVKGESSFDYSALSGESIAVQKGVNAKILSGCINIENIIIVKATKDFENSTLNKLCKHLEESISSKPNIEKKANQISGYFSIIILLLSLATLMFWMFFDTFEHSLIIAISVIVIACPCALALATPMAVLFGLLIASKNRIIFKEARFLETMAKADTIILDKTGTLTNAKLSVLSFDIIDKFDINILYSIVASQKHPISIAIKDYIKNNYTNIRQLELKDIKNIVSKGVSARFDGKRLLCGNMAFIKSFDIEVDYQIDGSEFIFAIDNSVVLIASLKDKLKDGAKEVIDWLFLNNFNILMVTGDNKKSAYDIAKKLNIQKFYAQMSPIQKADIVNNLQQKGHIVVMVGDGINDASSLAKSDVSIAMKSGSKIAMDSSDIILLDNSLFSLKNSIKISKTTYKFIKQNLFISFIYNALTIPLAMAGFVIPLVASISMSISSLLVVANSIRIKSSSKNIFIK